MFIPRNLNLIPRTIKMKLPITMQSFGSLHIFRKLLLLFYVATYIADTLFLCYRGDMLTTTIDYITRQYIIQELLRNVLMAAMCDNLYNLCV